MDTAILRSRILELAFQGNLEGAKFTLSKTQPLGELVDTLNGLWKGKTPPFIRVGVLRNANFTKSFTLRYDNVEYLDVEEKQYKTRKLRKDDLILEKSGGGPKQPVGRVVKFDKEDGEFSYSNFTSVLRIKNQDVLSSSFLYWFLQRIYLRGDTKSMQKATTGIHNIIFNKYLAIEVPLPPLAEQHRIVEKVEELLAAVDKIESAQSDIASAASILQSRILDLAFSGALTNSDTSTWSVKTLKDACSSISAGGDRPEICQDTPSSECNIPIYSNGVEKQGLYGYTNKAKCFEPCVTIAARGTIGFPFIRKTPFVPIVRLITAIPNSQILDLQYLYYYILCVRPHSTGTSTPQLTVPDCKALSIPLPPLAEQRRIVAKVESLFAAIDKLK